MSVYTPTLDEVRECYITTDPNPTGYGMLGLDPPTEEESRSEFDRFIRKVRAEAWDEGKRATAIATYRLIQLEENNPNATMNEMNALEPTNPYRVGE